jgi:hypothetical protein
MGVEVHTSGPIFDGRAQAAVADFCRDSEREVAQWGAGEVRQALHAVLRHPTGYYEGHVHAEQNQITDDRVVYGPWLEGTGSRNHTTRFKGYATFRRTTQKIQARAADIAERHLPPYLRRMN